MTSNSEELNQLQSLRFVVGWDIDKVNHDRTIVFVFDKLVQHIVYKVNTGKDRKTTYPYIQEFYGMNNCVPPCQLKIELYEEK